MKEKEQLLEQLQKWRTPMDRMYWIFLCIILLYDGLNGTVAPAYINSFFYSLLGDMDGELKELMLNNILGLRYLVLVPAVYTIVMDVKGRGKKLLLSGMLLFGWFYALYWREQNDTVIFEVMLLIVASYGRDFEKIGKISIITATSVLLFAFVMSMIGVFPDSIDMRGNLARHSFGLFHCTDLAAHWAFIILTYIFLKDGVIEWQAYLAIVILTALNFFLVDGRAAYLCVIAATIGSLAYTIAIRKGLKLPKAVAGVWQWLLLLSFVLFAAFYMILNFTYSDEPSVFYHSIGPIRNLGERLRTSYNVTRVLPFSLFGRYFIQIGAGMGADKTAGFYTFLDDSYIRVYVMYGIVAFVVILAILTAIQARLKKNGMTFRMFILAIVAFSCFIEHHMLELGCNIFLLLLFAKLPKKNPA